MMLKRFLIFILLFIQTVFCFGQEDGGKVIVPDQILAYFKTTYPKVTHVKWIYDGYSPAWLQGKAYAYRANFNYSAPNVFMHINYVLDASVVKAVQKDSTIVPMSVMSTFRCHFPNVCFPDWYCHHYPQYPSSKEEDTTYQTYFDYNYTNMMCRFEKDNHHGVHYYPLMETIKQLVTKIPTLNFNEDSTGYKFTSRKVVFVHKPAVSLANCKLDFRRNYDIGKGRTYRISGDMSIRDSLTYCIINLTDSLLFSDIRVYASDYKVFLGKTFFNPDSVKSWPGSDISIDDSNYLPEKIKLFIGKKFHKCRRGYILVYLNKEGEIDNIHVEMINRKEKVSYMEFDNHGDLTEPPSKFHSCGDN